MRRVTAIALGLVTSIALVGLGSLARGNPRARAWVVADDASGPLARIAIHYTPTADPSVLAIWHQLFAVLPASIEVEVEVEGAPDFARFMAALREGDVPNRGRFHPIVTPAPGMPRARGHVAVVEPDGRAAILARQGLALDGGDVVATRRWLFADASLVAKNPGADRRAIERELRRRFGQDPILLGRAVGDVPRHPIGTYLAPLDDRTIAVGDVHLGLALLGKAALTQDGAEAARFDRVAERLAAKGFRVVRTPALVGEGGGAFVTYTSALFDRERDGTRAVYLPTYGLAALDAAAQKLYESEGFVVHAVDVARLDAREGSLGGLVDVRARG